MALADLHCPRAVRGLQDRVAVELENVAGEGADFLVVLHHQDRDGGTREVSHPIAAEGGWSR